MISVSTISTIDIDLDEGIDLEELKQLISGDYKIVTSGDNILDRLLSFDNFLVKYFDEEYFYSALQDQILAIIDNYDFADLTASWNSKTYSKAIEIEGFIKNEIMPIIAPNHHVYRMNDDGNWGLYVELPSYGITRGSQKEKETIDAIMEASIYTKLMFIYDSKEIGLLNEAPNPNFLSDICMNIADSKHFIPFQDSQKKNKTNKMGEAIIDTDSHSLLNWVIDKLFADPHKAGIDKYLGSDLTRLWQEINEKDCVIGDFYLDDAYDLREKCSECEEIEEIDSQRYSDKSCGCCAYEALNNVWAIKDQYFFKELQRHGAMTYEGNGLYLYFQTGYNGYYNDSFLRKAWLTLDMWAINSVLSK